VRITIVLALEGRVSVRVSRVSIVSFLLGQARVRVRVRIIIGGRGLG
jgi:hypothetical protein